MAQAKVLMLGWRPEALAALRALGAEVTCVLTAADDGQRGGLLDDAHAIAVPDPADVAQVLAGLERRGRSAAEFTAIGAPGENPLLCAAILTRAGRWGGAGQWDGVRDALLLRDKDLQKRAVRAAGIPVADSSVIVRGADLLAFARPRGVLKPLDGTGTVGVRAWDGEGARSALAGQAGGGPWLAEEWVDGPEVHIDGVVRAGEVRFLSVARYLQPLLGIRDGGLVSSYALHPASDAPAYARAAALARDAARALRHRDGVFHLEAFERGDELVFGEYAGRVPGAHIPALIRFQHGVDLDLEWARVLLGRTTPAMPAPAAGYFGFVSLFGPAGVLASVPGADEIASHPGVCQVTMRARPGDVQPDAALASNVPAALAVVEGQGGREVVARMRRLAAWFAAACEVRPPGPARRGDAARRAGAAGPGGSPAPAAGPAPARPRLLIVGGCSPLESSIDIVSMALEQASSRGLRTHLTHRAQVLPQIRAAVELADGASAADPDSVAQTRRWALAAQGDGQGFDMVLGLRDAVVPAAAAAAEVFGVRGNPPAVVATVQNKDACRAALAAAGFRQPAVRLCASARDAADFMARSAGPWVVKPRDGAGSVGVRKVTGPADLPLALRELPDPDVFLVEEMLAGCEYSVEGVFLAGGPRVLAITAKYLLPPPHFVEAGHVLPAELPAGQRDRIEREVVRALTALGLRSGVFHVELWLTADGIVLGEVHPRPAGDWLHTLMTYAIPGLEIFGLLYDDLAGLAPPADLAPRRGAAIRYLSADPGWVVSVDGWDEVMSHPAVLRAELWARPGDLVPPVLSSGDRPGYVIVGASTPARARELAWSLAGSVRIETEPAAEADGPPLAAGRGK